MSDLKYVITFSDSQSGVKLFGVQDAFPLYHASLANGGKAFTHSTDRRGGMEITGTSFVIYTKGDKPEGISTGLIEKLEQYLGKITKGKMAQSTVTIYEVSVAGDATSYLVKRQVEHTDAEIGFRSGEAGSADHYIVSSDKATLSTPDDPTKAPTHRDIIDFVAGTINAAG